MSVAGGITAQFAPVFSVLAVQPLVQAPQRRLDLWFTAQPSAAHSQGGEYGVSTR